MGFEGPRYYLITNPGLLKVLSIGFGVIIFILSIIDLSLVPIDYRADTIPEDIRFFEDNMKRVEQEFLLGLTVIALIASSLLMAYHYLNLRAAFGLNSRHLDVVYHGIVGILFLIATGLYTNFGFYIFKVCFLSYRQFVPSGPTQVEALPCYPEIKLGIIFTNAFFALLQGLACVTCAYVENKTKYEDAKLVPLLPGPGSNKIKIPGPSVEISTLSSVETIAEALP